MNEHEQRIEPEDLKVIKGFLDKYCPKPEIILPLALDHWVVGESKGEDFLLREQDEGHVCYLIIRGKVEIKRRGRFIVERHEGDFLNEIAYLQRTIGKPKDVIVQADIQTLGAGVRFWTIGPPFEAALEKDDRRGEKAVWNETLAAVINSKLGQAIADRAYLERIIEGKDDWLGRFADGEALSLVRTAAVYGKQQVKQRNAIVWFSDIANFSTWAEDYRENPDMVGEIARRLTGIQIEQIRSHRGLIDKIQGDGVMAFWFIDTAALQSTVPRDAIQCAQEIVKQLRPELDKLNSERRNPEKPKVDIRIGMHSGMVAFGDFGTLGPNGRIAVTILGDVVNRASRYEAAKLRPDGQPLGRIRVSPDLKQLVQRCAEGSQIQFTAGVELKVKDTEIEIYCAAEEI